MNPKYHGWKPMEFREAVGFAALILEALLTDDTASVETITRDQLLKAQVALHDALRATTDDGGLMELVKEKDGADV